MRLTLRTLSTRAHDNFLLMNIKIFLFIFVSLCVQYFAPAQNMVQKKSLGNPEVAVIYYPHLGNVALDKSEKSKASSEWDFIKNAKPKFDGHRQPKIPYLAYPNSMNPKDVAMEIDIASSNGIDIFLYSWCENSCAESLERAFLQAPNNKKMKFAIMWASCNHMGNSPMKRDMAESLKILDYCIERYFKLPNYWRVDGRPYFAISNTKAFIEQMGGVDNVAVFFKKLAKKMESAGIARVHWAGVANNPKEGEMLKAAGFDSSFRDVMSTRDIKDFRARAKKGEKVFNYSELVKTSIAHWKNMAENLPLPNMPIVTQGWDCTPIRAKEEVIFVGNNADNFESFLRNAKEIAKSSKLKPPAILINAWNGWIHGSAIAPERREGIEFVRAVSRVFGKVNPKKLTFAYPYGKKVTTIDEPTFSHVKYGEHQKQFIDFWKADSNNPAPTVIYLHGGAWCHGSSFDSRLENFILPLVKKGFNVATVEYRFLEDARGIYPPVQAPVSDAVAALKFIKDRACDWNVDTSRIALMGGSAGACSSLITALGGSEGDVKMVSLWVAQTSLDPVQMREWDSGILYGNLAFGVKTFAEFLKNREKLLPIIKKYSPYELLNKTSVDIYITYPDSPNMGKKMKDPTHSPNFGPPFKEKCDKLGVKCKINYGSAQIQAVKEVEENL